MSSRDLARAGDDANPLAECPMRQARARVVLFLHIGAVSGVVGGKTGDTDAVSGARSRAD